MGIESTYCLWGKKSSTGEQKWLPLIMHLADTAEVGKLLWDRWLCEGAKRNIVEHSRFASDDLSESEKLHQMRALFVFLCAAHDLGKATPAFQTKDAHACWSADEAERDELKDKCIELDKMLLTRIREAGYICPNEMPDRFKTPHALCSQVILDAYSDEFDINFSNITSILGAHHGKPQDDPACYSSGTYPINYYGGKDGKKAWCQIQKQICRWALEQTLIFAEFEEMPCPNQIASVELCGLLIMADWISSNEYLFPLIHLDEMGDDTLSKERAARGFERIGLTHSWKPLSDVSFATSLDEYYVKRFGFNHSNLLQKTIIEIARSVEKSGIFVIEAPMGYGKTEAALAAAEILAKKSGRTGVFFALPTQATSNGIFPRLLDWVRCFDDTRCHSVKLFHCRAEFDKDWVELKKRIGENAAVKNNNGVNNEGNEYDDDPLLVNDWFSGRKKSMLADFVVGTVDQLLMGAFKHKHLMLRHLGIGNKVVVIDECHAYDAYMSVYLERIIEWLGKYDIPTIVLSATLPSAKRQAFIDRYTGNKTQFSKYEQAIYEDCPNRPEWALNRAYPLITYSRGKEVISTVIPKDGVSKSIYISQIRDNDVVDKVEELTKCGGCIGIIANSVRRAQEFYHLLCNRFGDEKAILFHSRFLMPDRAKIETEITHLLGKPGKETHRPELKIIVGTQVLEQSLDIDFDLLFTDLAPMDLLIQRMGRLHRHYRPRPEQLAVPQCFVMGIDDTGKPNRASVQIYGNKLLMRTQALLPELVQMPEDISGLVEDVYNDNFVIDSLPSKEYKEAVQQHEAKKQTKERTAKAFLISPPNTGYRSSLNRWLSSDGDKVAEKTAVRDIEESIEVILVQRLSDGLIHLLNEQHTPVAQHETPDENTAREIAKYSIELPLSVSHSSESHEMDKAIEILEQYTNELAQWQKSRWLKGTLCIILDENGHFNGLPDHELIYSKSEGLSYNKKEQSHA